MSKVPYHKTDMRRSLRAAIADIVKSHPKKKRKSILARLKAKFKSPQ